MESGATSWSSHRRSPWALCLRTLLPVVLALALCAAARADVDALWAPPSVTVAPGEQFELSFRAGPGEDLIASYQLYLSYDPAVLELVEATEGTLYLESGLMTWFVAEEEYPGFWHFFDTVFGAGSHVVPPGELLHLRFEALECGHTQAYVETLRFTDEIRDPLPVGSFVHADICVVPQTGIGESNARSELGPASPNPFVIETAIPFKLDGSAGCPSIEIYDIAGRLVFSRELPESETSGALEWDGTDHRGRELPASVYFVRLRVGHELARTRIVKLR